MTIDETVISGGVNPFCLRLSLLPSYMQLLSLHVPKCSCDLIFQVFTYNGFTFFIYNITYSLVMLLRSSSCHGLFPQFLILQNVENIATIFRELYQFSDLFRLFSLEVVNAKYHTIEMKINENILQTFYLLKIRNCSPLPS